MAKNEVNYINEKKKLNFGKHKSLSLFNPYTLKHV
jgi:hypothetical protein